MTCPKCGTELGTGMPISNAYGQDPTWVTAHTPDHCIAVLKRQWQEVAASASELARKFERLRDAERARADKLEAKLEIAREALELIDHVYGGSKTARDALAALAKETENA